MPTPDLEFTFPAPPPFTYAQFCEQHYPKVLGIITGPGGDHLRALDGDLAEFNRRFFYVLIVTKLHRPELPFASMLYEINYGLLRHQLDAGKSADEVRREMAAIAWDSLPGADGYTQETLESLHNSVLHAGRRISPLPDVDQAYIKLCKPATFFRISV